MTQFRSRQRSLRSRTATGVLGLFLVLGAAACGDDDATTAPASSAATLPAESTAPVVEGAWARTSPMGVDVGAAYAVITSPIDDVLVDVRVDASIAGRAELHEMAMADGAMDDHSSMPGMGSDTTMAMGGATTMPMSGEMVMREVDEIDLPAGVAVELKPGGFHIMLLELVAPLELGSTIEITLVFETAGEITIQVPVLDEAP